jgi:hypothetical protein
MGELEKTNPMEKRESVLAVRGKREKLGEERAKAGVIFPTYKYKCGGVGNIHGFWGCLG